MLPIPADEDEYMSMHSFRSIKDLSVIPFMEAGFPVHHVPQESTYSKLISGQNLCPTAQVAFPINLTNLQVVSLC